MRGILAAEQRKSIKEARKLLKTSNMALHVGSVALAIEALETLLVEKGVLRDNELMEKLEVLMKEKAGDPLIHGHMPGDDD